MKIFKLIKVYNRFINEVNSIEEALLNSEYTTRKTFCSRYVGEYAAIRLLDTWSNYCRDMIIISSIYPTLDASGNIYSRSPRNLKNTDELYALLRNEWINSTGQRNRKPAHWEPSWYDPGQIATCLTILRISNSNVGGAIGLTTNPIEELRPLRNYVAHRGKGTRIGLDLLLSNSNTSIGRLYGGSWNQPIDIISIQIDPTIFPEKTIFSEWISRFKLVAKSMIY